MKAVLENVSPIKKAIKVEVPVDQVKLSRKKALEEIGKEIKVPGFRKGKVPANIVEKQLGREADQEVIRHIVNDTYPKALQEVDAKPISDPQVEPGELSENKPFSYKATFEVYPELKKLEYKGLKLEIEELEMNEGEVDRELETLQRRMTQLEPAPEGSVAAGFMALVDYHGTADGAVFDGSTMENFVVDYGSGNLLKEFEQAITGMKVGESKKISFTYPKDFFNKELSGKKGEFEVKVKEVRKKTVPALDDEFAKSLGGTYQTIADLRKDLKTRIEQARAEVKRQRLHRAVVEKLSEEHPVEIPQTMINAELSNMLQQMDQEAKAQKTTLEKSGFNLQNFLKTARPEAELRARAFLVIGELIKKEALKITEEDINARVKKIAESARESFEKVRAYLEQQRMLGRIETELMIEKALDFVVNEAKIKEVKPKKDKKS